jgi:hypothetical protein
MITIDLSNYSLFFLEFLFSAIVSKYTKNEYIVQHNKKNELTLHFKDKYREYTFPFPNRNDITHIYLKFDSPEEMQIYIDLLNHHHEENIEEWNTETKIL